MTVMHARKFSRVNDGHYDRGQSQGYQNSEHYSASGKSRSSDTYYKDPKEVRSKPGIDPETRARSKDKYDKFGGKARDGGPHGSSSGHSRDRGGKDDEEKHRAEVAKTALDVSGDWSVHRSSSGKVYYYNCKTEVSQWQKPKDWVDPRGNERATRGGEDRERREREQNGDRARHHNAETPDAKRRPSAAVRESQEEQVRSRHTSGSGGTQSTQPPEQRQLSHSAQSGRQLQAVRDNGTAREREDRRNSAAPAAQKSDVSGLVSQRQETLDERLRRIMSGEKGAKEEDERQNKRRRQDSTPSSRPENHESRQEEDMDISPGNSPIPSPRKRPSPRQSGRPQQHPSSRGNHTVTSQAPQESSGGMPIPSLVSSQPVHTAPANHAPPASLPNMSHDIATKAIQTLQKLQQALKRQQQQQQQMTSPNLAAVASSPPPVAAASVPTSQSSAASVATAAAAPASEAHNNSNSSGTRRERTESEREGGPADSPRSQHSNKSTGSGPTLSKLSCAVTKPASALQDPALVQYVSNQLTLHVSNWPGVHFEKEADKASAHYHGPVTASLSEVAVRLKRSRSAVRDAELGFSLKQARMESLTLQLREMEESKTNNHYLPPS